MRCKNPYRLPLRKNEIEDWSKRESPAHRGKLRHSIDFFVPEDTKVYAAAGGRVVYVKQDSNAGGNQEILVHGEPHRPAPQEF